MKAEGRRVRAKSERGGFDWMWSESGGSDRAKKQETFAPGGGFLVCIAGEKENAYVDGMRGKRKK